MGGPGRAAWQSPQGAAELKNIVTPAQAGAQGCWYGEAIWLNKKRKGVGDKWE